MPDADRRKNFRQAGIVDPPRVVPGDTYVAKYYRITAELRTGLHPDPVWYERQGETLTPEDQ